MAGTLWLLLGKLLPAKPWAVVLVWILLAIEVIGIILVISAELSTLKLTFAHQRREFAEILDFDMPHHENLVAWLRSFPRERLQAMSDFSAFRVERYRSKMPILTGGMEKLGVLSILAALVVQFKDMQWPPHPTLWQIVLLRLIPSKYPEQKALPAAMPPPDDVSIFRIEPTVVSVLDYTQGFGHADLVTCP